MHRVIFFYYPLFLNYHSLLTHLLRFEFAVLLFDCERHKPAAQNCQQLYFYLRAIKVFCLHSLERKAFLQKSAYSLPLIFSEVRAFLQDL